MDQNKLWQEKWKNMPKQLPRNNFASKVFKLFKSNHKTLLDIGCGVGRDTLFFANKGLHVTAIDWSQSGLDQLKQEAKSKNLANLEVIKMDTSEINFKKNSFDIIYAHLSLHYFDDKTTQKIFNKLYSILKKDGLLCVKCKSTDDMLYGRGKKIGNNMFLFKKHVRHFFNKDFMTSLLAKFKIIRVKKSTSVYHSYKSSFIEAIATK